MRSTVGPERCWWSWYAGQVSERRRSARSGRVDRPISFSVPLRRLTLRVGFEVRSLPEFMAARALVAGDSAAVLEWLRCLAPSAHWRNTWLLAAGRAFTHHEHRRDPIVTLLDDLDTSNLLAMLVMPGARLAIDILADDIAIQAPRYRHLFAKRAMQLLASPPEATTHRLAYVLRDACEAHPPTRLMVDNAIDRTLATGGQTSVTPVMVLVMWEGGTDALAASARHRLHRLVRALDHQQRRTLAPPVGNLREKTHRCRTAFIIRGRVTARHG